MHRVILGALVGASAYAAWNYFTVPPTVVGGVPVSPFALTPSLGIAASVGAALFWAAGR